MTVKTMLYVFYSIILFLLTVYSYSQIDLNLTLSSNPIYQSIQHQLILLGYFNRPLSALVISVLLFLLYLFYIGIIILVKNRKLSSNQILGLVAITAAVLFFSYSAFSHDLFNYMFDARIVTKYHQNPYFHTALDFPGDLWTRFMHWTHRTYPYGPSWLAITLIPSFLGFGKFVLTLFNFKLMFTVFHIGNVYLIYKILGKVQPKLSLLGVTLYAFNPVVLIESVISPHNEVIMLFFLLLSIYGIFGKNNKVFAILSLLLSAGIKFTSIILLPVFFFINNVKKSDKTSVWFLSFLILITVTLVGEIIYREPYPWYFLPVIGLGALLVQHPSVNILICGISFAALLRYLPYLYMGDYGKPVVASQNILFLSGVFFTFLLIFLRIMMRNFIFPKLRQ